MCFVNIPERRYCVADYFFNVKCQAKVCDMYILVNLIKFILGSINAQHFTKIREVTEIASGSFYQYHNKIE